MRELGRCLRIGKLRLTKTPTRSASPARFSDKGYLEYLLVTHRAALTKASAREIQPGDLHFAMLLLGAKGAGILTPGPADKPPAQIDAAYLKRAPRLKGDPLTITAT
jgi:hypothetical protein